jgi:hypothetical protein
MSCYFSGLADGPQGAFTPLAFLAQYFQFALDLLDVARLEDVVEHGDGAKPGGYHQPL